MVLIDDRSLELLLKPVDGVEGEGGCLGWIGGGGEDSGGGGEIDIAGGTTDDDDLEGLRGRVDVGDAEFWGK